MEMIFHSHENKTHFHKKGCAFGIILKVRVFGTRKWPIGLFEFAHVGLYRRDYCCQIALRECFRDASASFIDYNKVDLERARDWFQIGSP